MTRSRGTGSRPTAGRARLLPENCGHIEAFLAQKRGQGYAKNSVRLMRAPLSAMLSDAMDDGIILANPAFQVGRHKTNRADRLTSAERVQKVRPMTWEQRDAFLAAAGAETRYVTLFAVLAKAGLRQGEAFALRPGDIDWGERTLRVERAWNLGRVKPPKTYEERTVDLTPDLVRALAQHMTCGVLTGLTPMAQRTHQWARAAATTVQVERRGDVKRRRRFFTARRSWKSLRHGRGGQPFLAKLS